MAMGIEAQPLVETMGAASVDIPLTVGPLPVRWFGGTVADHPTTEFLISVNGVDPRHRVASIGTQPAALNTYATVKAWQPDVVMSVGAAGGWAHRGAAVGDLILGADAIVYHDRRIAMPGFDAYGIGSYPCVFDDELADVIGARPGRVTTSNSLDETDDDRRMIAANGGDAKEMEAAAVASVADLFGLPMIALKAITDLVDSPIDTADQFDANLAVAMQTLIAAVPKTLRWLASPA